MVVPGRILHYKVQVTFLNSCSLYSLVWGQKKSDFQTVFCVWQITDFWSFSSKEKLKKTILRVPFLPLKIAFFSFFENDKHFRSKSYMVTKSIISPQRKLGSFWNFRLFLIRYQLIRDDLKKKNGKISDIEQKGGRGLSQIHSF